MFDFLSAFEGAASIFATGSSLLNTYANLRANRERQKQSLYEQQQYLRMQRETANFDQRQLREKTAEYGAISSYHVDMLRQDQMYRRQSLAYNMLNSGVGISSTDSAGLLIKHQAYNDEMKARSVEAEYFHGRPRSNYNSALADLQKEAVMRNISGIKSAAPWVTAGTVLGGVRDLAEIARLGK